MQSPWESWRLLAGSPRDLYVTFAVKVLVALPQFCTLLTVTLLLTEDFGLSDIWAGWVFGAHGAGVAAMTLGAGFAIDSSGVRKALVFACALEGLGCIVVALTDSVHVAVAMLVVVCPTALAIAIPALKVAVKRFSAEDVRHEAFGCLYVVGNISVGLASLSITASRFFAGSTGDMSVWRIVFLVAGLAGLAGSLLSLTIEDAQEVRALPDSSTPFLRDDGFWRLVGLNTIFIFAFSSFRHMEATFPKFMHRVHGPDALFELFVIINPITVILMVPIVIAEIKRRDMRVDGVLLVGSCITALSVVPFFFSSSMIASALYVFILSIGEVVWSPKLMEYTLSLCPEGREGVYASLASVPMFVSKLFVGGFSGHILEAQCPEFGNCDSVMMWGVIFVTLTFTPVLLFAAREPLFPAQHNKLPAQHKKLDEESAMKVGKTEIE